MKILLIAFALLLSSRAGATEELFVVTTTFEVVGSTGRIGIDGGYPTVADEFQVHSDAVVRQQNGFVFVINRLFADNVLVLDAADDYGVVTQFGVSGTGLNPRDLELVGDDRAYVTLYESNELLICNPFTGTTLGTIDLSAFAVADGLVEMDQIARVGDRVFVTLQNVDRRVTPWAVTGASTIAVIDTNTDTLVDADPGAPGVQGIELQIQNPYWRFEYDPGRQRLFMIGAGSFQQSDGGLERIHPFTLRSEGPVLTEAGLDGDLLDVALVDDATGWALINDPTFNTCLVRFDPTTGERTDTVLCTSGFLLSDLELSRDGRIFVGDRTPSNPGIRVYDASTAQLLSGPLDVGLPPFDATLIEGVPTGAPVPTRPARLAAHPNPFNPRVTIGLDGAEHDGVVEIVDARGRRVRTLALEAGTAIWNGMDSEGRPAASGIYRARLRGRDDVTAVPLTLVR
ncbi:MAG TPA: FlgD immunoglobulin-like domain containing protein [Candidatus Krumholzibacteria bacterium]|nr:FlgD immunoglobulin-like domain containing protein [Candidatus Krumholzibacteria bacterium]